LQADGVDDLTSAALIRGSDARECCTYMRGRWVATGGKSLGNGPIQIWNYAGFILSHKLSL